jgi:hypothetical protein
MSLKASAICAAIVLMFAILSANAKQSPDPNRYRRNPNFNTYVGNDPANKTDPMGLYHYTCQTGSHIACAQGFESTQERTAGELQGAAGRLGSAIADIKSVAAQQAGGNTTATISAATAQTEGAFTAVYGKQADMAGAMATVQSGLNAAVVGLSGNGAAPNATGDVLTKMQNGSAVIQTVLGSHQLAVNGGGWNDINSRQQRWALGHDALHAEMGWGDYKGPNGEKYFRWQSGGKSPLLVPGPANLTNPENAMCFVYGGCQ